MIAEKSKRPRARSYSHHGLNTLRKSLKYSGNALTSRRYKLGRVLSQARSCHGLLPRDRVGTVTFDLRALLR